MTKPLPAGSVRLDARGNIIGASSEARERMGLPKSRRRVRTEAPPDPTTITIAARYENRPDGGTVIAPLRIYGEKNYREHWTRAGRWTTAYRTIGKALAMLAGTPPAVLVPLPVAVTLTRLAPSKGLDDDNLARGFSAVRDGIADAYGIADNDPRIAFRYAQERASTYAIRLEITTARKDPTP